MGAATADMLHGAVAAFGLTAVSGLLVRQQSWFGLVGGIFLLYLGARTFGASPWREAPLPSASGVLRAYGSTLVLTLSNPVTILALAAIFAGLGVAEGENAASGALLVAGVFLGSAVWRVILSMGVGAARAWFGDARMRRVRGAGSSARSPVPGSLRKALPVPPSTQVSARVRCRWAGRRHARLALAHAFAADKPGMSVHPGELPVRRKGTAAAAANVPSQGREVAHCVLSARGEVRDLRTSRASRCGEGGPTPIGIGPWRRPRPEEAGSDAVLWRMRRTGWGG